MSDKDELREHALLHRRSLHADSENPEDAARLFCDHVPLKNDSIVALYWPTDDEFDCRYLIQDLLNQGIDICLPVAKKGQNRVMTFSRWGGHGDLIRGDFNIFVPPVLDPVIPDIIVTPFLAFDRKGHRLGRGGGHYDATLADLRAKKPVLAVGIGYASQAVLFNLPSEPHDQRLDMVVTPLGVHDFRI